MIDPYAMLGLDQDADETAIKAAYRKKVKSAHPDAGGDPDEFGKITLSYELLKDPIRRRVYDDTGYDPELADIVDLKGLMVLETLINDMILDEREPGSFDPVAGLRRKLTDDLLKARFHILELERHRTRIRKHLDRLERRPETDVLGSMLRGRTLSIAEAIKAAEVQIGAIERAYGMLEGYSYELEPVSIAIADPMVDLPKAAE